MCSISFYTNNDYEGTSVTYSGPQGQSGNLMDGIDSLKTASNTWVVVYNSDNYGGDFMKVGPSSNLSDLNHVDRSGGDWKNQIQSFVMYAEQPPFWNQSSGGPTIPLSGCEVFFSENTNYLGGTLFYNSPTNVPNLSKVDYTGTSQEADNSINSLKTGSQAWMVIYNDNDYTGDYLKIYPNTSYPDLNKVGRGSSGDWKNQIRSFELFSQLPADWGLSFSLSTFQNQFPDKYSDSTVSGSAIGYRTQDAQYRIYDPQVSFTSDNLLLVSVTIDHIINMGVDDHVELGIYFNGDGSLNSVSYSWDAGGAYEIPKSVVVAVDAAVELAAAVGAIETLGVDEVVAQEFVEDFDTACKVFNKIASFMYKWTENDGGRFYLMAVVSHVINRVCSSVTKS